MILALRVGDGVGGHARLVVEGVGQGPRLCAEGAALYGEPDLHCRSSAGLRWRTTCPACGGVVISEAGTDPKVAGLVYIAAFAPDAGICAAGGAADAARSVRAKPIQSASDTSAKAPSIASAAG